MSYVSHHGLLFIDLVDPARVLQIGHDCGQVPVVACGEAQGALVTHETMVDFD